MLSQYVCILNDMLPAIVLINKDLTSTLQGKLLETAKLYYIENIKHSDFIQRCLKHDYQERNSFEQ